MQRIGCKELDRSKRSLYLLLFTLTLALAVIGYRATTSINDVGEDGIVLTGDTAEKSGFAMGTYYKLQLTGEHSRKAVAACIAELERLDALLDRFDPRSEVSKLNARAGQGWVEVSPDIISILETTLDVAVKSRGAYDPSIAALVDLWGFREQRGKIPDHAPPSPQQIQQVLRENVGYQKVQMDAVNNRVSLAAGIVLDFGSAAKGYALDRLTALAKSFEVEHGLIDLGGNIGVIGVRQDGKPWNIAVRHPRELGEVFGVIPVKDQYLATSGDYQRYFTWDGRRYPHIIDPHTGYPTTDYASVTIVAPTGILSDVLSTALFVLGPERGADLLTHYPGVEALYIDQNMQVTITPGLKDVVQLVQ
jgi:thiamine biosynthesis lipoprotein